MKVILICPAIRPALPHLAEARPLATVPILGECLINHWIEHVAAHGARHVIVLAADRAEQVKAVTGDGERWGVRIDVVPTAAEVTVAEATAHYRVGTGWLSALPPVIALSHLPGCPERPLFDSQAAWFAAVLGWIPRALTPARMRVNEIRPGVWVGRRARVSPHAHLVAPCWIGDQASIGPQAVVGGGAVVEDRAVLEVGARVGQSYVAPDTFVGRMTAVVNSLAVGNSLINWQTDSVLRVPDPFLLCSLARPPAAPWAGGAMTRTSGVMVRAVGAAFSLLAAWGARPVRASDLKLPG